MTSTEDTNEPNSVVPQETQETTNAEFTLREAQVDTLRQFFNDFKAYETKVSPELRRLSSRFNEFLNYVRVDLGVPAGYMITQDMTKFILIESEQATIEQAPAKDSEVCK